MASKQSILVVGAGFSGAVIARELAELGNKITVIDSRNHIGGNTFDYVNEYGIRIHKYGPHIFHTDNKTVFDWLSKFTEWIEYRHRVKAMLNDGSLEIFPPTKSMIDKWGEEKIVNTFYKPYSEKMWGCKFNQIDSSIINRVRIRQDDTPYYFLNQKYQFMPKQGYTKLFEKIFDHKNIEVKLEKPFKKLLENEYDHVYNSMSIDEYYDYCYGFLPYRSIKFTTVNLPLSKLFDVSVINFTHRGQETRIVEWKNFPGQEFYNLNITTLTYETPCDYKDNNWERYYPVKDSDGKNKEIYKMYSEIPNDKTTFIGRCGQYAYLDMDQAISASLAITKKIKKK